MYSPSPTPAGLWLGPQKEDGWPVQTARTSGPKWLSRAAACVPLWVWPAGSDSNYFCCSHGGFPPLGGVSSLPSLGTVVYAQVPCNHGQSSELYYTLPAYWYVGTPPSDHVAPNLTCIQCPLPRPSPLLQSRARIQLLGCHLSSRPSWAAPPP